MSFFFFAAGRFRVDNDNDVDDNDAGETDDDSYAGDMESEDECLDGISRIHDEFLGSIDDGGIDGDVRTEAEAGSGDDNGWAIGGKSNSAKARNGTTMEARRIL